MATILSLPQRTFLRVLLALGIFVLANSAYLFFSDGGEALTVFYQLMLLSHLAGGFLLLVLATVFLIWHLSRARRLMSARAAVSGGSLTLATYLLFATGVFILYESNSRDHYWVLVSHQVLALLAPTAYAAHRLVSHFRPERRAMVQGATAFTVCLLLMVVVHVVNPPGAVVAASDAAASGAAADPYLPFSPRNFPDESSPFFPSSATTDSGGFFDARILTRDERGDFERIRADVGKLGFAAETAIGAETCRRCHADVVVQWEASAHRFASFNNPFYRASVEAMRETVGERKSQWCAACHDPAIMLAGNMTEEIDPLTPESQAGLTCLACHAIDRLHGIEGNGNYNVADGKPSPYLFDESSSGWGRWLADQMTKAKPTAHKRMFLRPFFREPEFCSTCHKVSLDVPVNGYKWIRGQDEYDSWHDSGVSQNAARTFYLPAAARRCQDCHMPPEAAPLGDLAAKGGTVRSHRFVAANTALPFIRGDDESVARTEAFLKAGKLWIDVFALQYTTGDRTTVRALDRARPGLVAGEEVIFEVVVRNKGVGHAFPGGTIDSNEAWIDFRVLDGSGREVFRSGAIDEDGHVDESAHFYRSVMVRHDGTRGDERDAHNFHVAAFSRVIGPGTADLARYGVVVPKEAAGGRLRVEARLLWRKFNRGYTEFTFSRPGILVPDLPHLEAQGREIPFLPVTVVATGSVHLDVREERGDAGAVDDPDVWVRFNDHGIASLLQGAFDVAEQSFREVARLRPDLPDGYRNLARRWIRSATPGEAEPMLRKVDGIAATDPQRPYFWGRYFERMEEFEAAEEAYEASLAVFPDDRDAWRRLGAVRYKLHSYEASLDAYLEVLRIDPEDREAHKRRRDIYRQMGREQDAAEAGRAFAKYKRDEEAEQIARQFLLDHPEINHDAQPRHIHR